MRYRSEVFGAALFHGENPFTGQWPRAKRSKTRIRPAESVLICGSHLHRHRYGLKAKLRFVSWFKGALALRQEKNLFACRVFKNRLEWSCTLAEGGWYFWQILGSALWRVTKLVQCLLIKLMLVAVVLKAPRISRTGLITEQTPLRKTE